MTENRKGWEERSCRSTSEAIMAHIVPWKVRLRTECK